MAPERSHDVHQTDSSCPGIYLSRRQFAFLQTRIRAHWLPHRIPGVQRLMGDIVGKAAEQTASRLRSWRPGVFAETLRRFLNLADQVSLACLPYSLRNADAGSVRPAR